MKRTWVSAKELAVELGVSADSVYRAYRTGEIPGSMKKRAEAMPNSQCTKRAAGGDSRRRARGNSPRSVKRGRNFQNGKRRSV
jgi:hypothetical protein